MIGIGEILFRADIVMIVLHVGLHVLERHGGDELKVGVLRLDGLVKLRVPAFVVVRAIELIFVADFDIAELEWCRMAVFDALGSPLGIGAAGHIFDFIERVLDVRLESGAGLSGFLREGVAGIDSEQGLHVKVFAPSEKFKKTHAVGGLVVPRTAVRRTVDKRADSLLPLEALVDVVALEIVAAGETEELRMHGGHFFHQIGAKAVGSIVVGGREQRDELQPKGSVVSSSDGKVVGGRGLNGAGFELEGVLLPVRGEAGDGGSRNGFAGVVADETDGDGTDGCRVGFGVEGAVVGSVGAKGHTPPAVVEHTGLVAPIGLGDLDFEACRKRSAGPGSFVVGHFRDGIAIFDEIPGMNTTPVAAESAVADHLGIEATIVGVVDFFGHQSVEDGADCGGGLVGMKGECGGGALRGESQSRCKRDEQREDAGKRFLRHA